MYQSPYKNALVSKLKILPKMNKLLNFPLLYSHSSKILKDYGTYPDLKNLGKKAVYNFVHNWIEYFDTCSVNAEIFHYVYPTLVKLFSK